MGSSKTISGEKANSGNIFSLSPSINFILAHTGAVFSSFSPRLNASDNSNETIGFRSIKVTLYPDAASKKESSPSPAVPSTTVIALLSLSLNLAALNKTSPRKLFSFNRGKSRLKSPFNDCLPSDNATPSPSNNRKRSPLSKLSPFSPVALSSTTDRFSVFAKKAT